VIKSANRVDEMFTKAAHGFWNVKPLSEFVEVKEEEEDL